MKTYTITSPSIDGILSDDFLYFEGVNRPAEIYSLRDNMQTSDKSIDVLEKYFNDIYNLFLRKLSSFAIFENADEVETTKMQALLQEMIKVKSMISNSSTETEKDGDLL